MLVKLKPFISYIMSLLLHVKRDSGGVEVVNENMMAPDLGARCTYLGEGPVEAHWYVPTPTIRVKRKHSHDAR